MATEAAEVKDVIVVGAGPVGLFAALTAVRSGLSVDVIQRSGAARGVAAPTLVHARTLQLLAPLGVAEALEREGQPVERVKIRSGDETLAVLQLAAPLLALPPNRLRTILLHALEAAGIQPRVPYQANAVLQDSEVVRLRVLRGELSNHADPVWRPVESSLLRARFVIGADGASSTIRDALGIKAMDVSPVERFIADSFPDPDGSEPDICLDFGQVGNGCSIPLRGQRLRYDGRSPSRGAAAAIVVQQRLAVRFGVGRCWLVGDAAHVTSPFGGQSINVGLAETAELVAAMCGCLRTGGSLEPLQRFEADRQREWHKLLGLNVHFDLSADAPPWLRGIARQLLPSLPASGRELRALSEGLGLRIS